MLQPVEDKQADAEQVRQQQARLQEENQRRKEKAAERKKKNAQKRKAQAAEHKAQEAAAKAEVGHARASLRSWSSCFFASCVRGCCCMGSAESARPCLCLASFLVSPLCRFLCKNLLVCGFSWNNLLKAQSHAVQFCHLSCVHHDAEVTLHAYGRIHKVSAAAQCCCCALPAQACESHWAFAASTRT